MSHTIILRSARQSDTTILVGVGAADSLPDGQVPFKRAALVVDRHVAQLHGEVIENITRQWAQFAETILVEAGERSKTLAGAQELFARFSSQGLSRGDAIIAIGGGTITDLASFAAQLYLRGLPLVLFPTTLLAQVDAAIGGKNGLNLNGHKNQIGSFYYPRWVVCDTGILATLPRRQIAGGLAEVIKVQAVRDSSALPDVCAWGHAMLYTGQPDMTTAVATAIQAKVDLLSSDPFENSQERLLNFGHTFAHGFESASDFQLTHGEAVMLSMLLEVRMGLLAEGLGASVAASFEEQLLAFIPPACRDFQITDREIEQIVLSNRAMRVDTTTLWRSRLVDQVISSEMSRLTLQQKPGMISAVLARGGPQ